MTVLMDDPTTYLAKDTDNVAIICGGGIGKVQEFCVQYGCSIQVSSTAGVKTGIRVVRTVQHATDVIADLPATTPWAFVDLVDNFEENAYKMLLNYFGKPTTPDKALNVQNVGRAWRADTFLMHG